MALICELDEQWTFVGSKARQHWLWYAYNTKTGGVLAYTFGPRIAFYLCFGFSQMDSAFLKSDAPVQSI